MTIQVSGVQIILATLPLLGVTLLFLYDAITRGGGDYNNNNDNKYMTLLQMLYLFLSLHVITFVITIYYKFYIPRRHDIINQYMNHGKKISGNIICDNGSNKLIHAIVGGQGRGVGCNVTTGISGSDSSSSSSRSRRASKKDSIREGYGMLQYMYPDPHKLYQRNDIHNHDTDNTLTATANIKKPPRYVVQKQVIVYEHITREGICILYLPDYPLSGQIESQIEVMKLLNTKSKSKTQLLANYGIFWMIYTFISCIIVLLRLHQQHKQQQQNQQTNYYDNYYNNNENDIKIGCIIFGVVTFAISPMIAILGNHLYHIYFYQNKLLYGGSRGGSSNIKTSGGSNVAVYPENEAILTTIISLTTMNSSAIMSSSLPRQTTTPDNTSFTSSLPQKGTHPSVIMKQSNTNISSLVGGVSSSSSSRSSSSETASSYSYRALN